ncbi:hypothetical protein [Streptomyces sp. NPDC093149]|uniref:hypothetical protein n=1 Tax=Streptomyces sp. NPDC093149 TaxID=3366031 RepID=UPI00382FEEAE
MTCWMSVEAYQQAHGPKKPLRIDGAVHNDLYNKDEYVVPAIAKPADFFATHLTPGPEHRTLSASV